ncbi:MAG: DUF922 domain-containing protein [Pseudomonadota bacterium]
MTTSKPIAAPAANAIVRRHNKRTGFPGFLGIAAGLFAIATMSAFNAPAADAAPVKIKEKTKYYTVSGRTAAELAISMSGKGPYSRQHRRRAWATAARSLTYQIYRKRDAKGCRITEAKVDLDITYTIPKLKKGQRISKSQHRKWRRMQALLVRHENKHGEYYKQFARKTQRELMRLPRAKSCRALDKQANKLVARLSEEDSDRNDRFDANDGRNYRRMARLYGG